MISGAATSCYPNLPQGLQMFSMTEEVVSPSVEASSATETHSNSLIYGLSLLKDKVNQAQSMVSILVSSNLQSQPESKSIAISNMGTLIQEIIVTASSMMFVCQQMAIDPISGNNNTDNLCQVRAKAQENGVSQPNISHERGQSFFSSDTTFDWYGDNNYNSCNINENNIKGMHVINNKLSEQVENGRERLQGRLSPKNYDIIELEVADLLAKYTHYCQVCGKGFKRDANLRMHMRAHGDEYKTSAALSNPMKGKTSAMEDEDCLPKKYSCPQEGCRWNQKHAKFQPLKSMICVKNHYRRSHCPKMYVCKRCNRKQFSVLSDLRTHEKHCGDLKWQCSCGTTFSRKDKLMGHVALFVGHSPVIAPAAGKVEDKATVIDRVC